MKSVNLTGALGADQQVALGQPNRLGLVDPAFEQFAGDGEAGALQVLHRILQRAIALAASAVGRPASG